MLLGTTNGKPNSTCFNWPGRFQDVINVPKQRLLLGSFRRSEALWRPYSSPLPSLSGQLRLGPARSGAPLTGMICPGHEKGWLSPSPPFKCQGTCPVPHPHVSLARARSTCSPEPITGKGNRPTRVTWPIRTYPETWGRVDS